MLRTELRFYEAKDKANKFSIYWIKQGRKSFTKRTRLKILFSLQAAQGENHKFTYLLLNYAKQC